MKKLLLVAVAFFVSITSASAQFTFTSLDYPGATLTRGRGINDHGEIVGQPLTVPPAHAYLFKAGQFAQSDGGIRGPGMIRPRSKFRIRGNDSV
jgi:hypothetical protein